MDITSLTPVTGKRITNFNIKRMSETDLSQLKSLIAEHGVIHIPGQHLTPDELESAALNFGEGWLGDFLKPLEGQKFAIPIANKGKALAISERWHADSTYDQYPPYLSFLSAVDIPPLGGDTMWTSQYLAYEFLPEGLKKLIAPLKAVHYNRGQVKVRTGESRDDLPGFAHPLVIRHPVSGKPVFYLSAHAEHIEGLSREDSAPIFQLLRNYIGQPALSYRHQWQPGDLLIWDNRCTMHFAIHDYGDYPRFMNRVTVAGPQPEAWFPDKADN
ncbi:TauD/TfdA family dioxygenase [Erwiniaceae bacterium BAC15a-03b]|uniref:TauD/TfdA family dioxygenase n=1 Tax=Winslowiella arboricola TaxID=2978220 RepID=A0A9J6PQK6_9GAMM|nr:TauD/TfdA family dioxygenase [Winslowiella arboricola]MCU5772492.1 TauD/TfdA family dioxygenase [Winslowiella arboricola]MCU5779014.1 TauD/TfdA family dioxygenase [Winslowiella arboricola]